jgi:hypothetical protein
MRLSVDQGFLESRAYFWFISATLKTSMELTEMINKCLIMAGQVDGWIDRSVVLGVGCMGEWMVEYSIIAGNPE